MPAIKFSLFANSKAKEPAETIEVSEFVNRIKVGYWLKEVMKLKDKKGLPSYKKIKEGLPGATISSILRTRDKYTPIKDRLNKHTGLICLDIDKKDNPKMRVKDLIDRECLLQYVSCSGEGMKIVYKCATTRDPKVHRRIYDAAVKRLEDKGFKLKVDPIVKNIASMQFVSYDPNIFYIPNTKLVIKPLPPIKIKRVPPSENQKQDIEQLNEYIQSLEKDVTSSYESWLSICMGLTYSLGEAGRAPFHEISKLYPEYSEEECNEKFDSCLERDVSTIENPVTLATVFQELYKGIPPALRRQLGKKYNKKHAVGVGEEAGEGDLAGMVRHKLFLFKKETDKHNKVIDLKPARLNLNEFETLLKTLGFYRYGKFYVQVQENIAEIVDEYDILRIVTNHVETDGDYEFSYDNVLYHFSWEDLAHLWREIRAQGTTFNQIASCLTHWVPNLLKDDSKTSYIPYKNGVLEITAKTRKLISYKTIDKQIWKERILPRDFNYTQEVGMFEEFFLNLTSPGKVRKQRIQAERYKSAFWNFGYMLHSHKSKSLARAWMLYDIKAGNNGRTGKSILGEAIGYIRNVVTIDGKREDFRDGNRFALQKVTPATEVIFIDDPKRGMSLGPLFNMITGKADAERKGKDPIELLLKFVFASNWIMEMEGTSEQGRQFVTQIDDYYSSYAKEKNCLRPIVEIHGKEFFTEWNDKDWAQFDSFCARALQYHLGSKIPSNTIPANAFQIRFIQQHDEELFFELSLELCKTIQKSREGYLIVPQKTMVSVLKDSNDSIKANRAGRIIRDYFRAIGVPDVGVTSFNIGGLTGMAYKIEVPYEKLNFGKMPVPKPKML